MSGTRITIEQRLQDPRRVIFLPLDEAIVLLLPSLMGLMARNPLMGFLLAFLIWSGWKYLKGDGGVPRLLALTYWYIPRSLSPYRSLPDSARALWRG